MCRRKKARFFLSSNTGAYIIDTTSTSRAASLPYTGGWDFLTVTLDGYSLTIYMNGILSQNFSISPFFLPASIVRDQNYIGNGGSGSLNHGHKYHA